MALAEQRFDDALASFEELEKKSLSDINVQSSILIRKGEALAQLGRNLEAQKNFITALDQIDQTLPNYAADILIANKFLASMAYNRYDYAAAGEYYLQAAEFDDRPAVKINIMVGAIAVLMFTDTNRALEIAKQVDEVAQSDKSIDKDLRAQSAMMLGRTHLNMQQFAEARRQLGKAVSLLGGLTQSVYINDIQARSDHATASALLDDPDRMRQYLSYTGAGRFEGSAFLKASDVSLPACDPAKDIFSDDVVVVEFGISSNGTVTYSRPIYSNKPQKIAVLFAQAVKNWSWTADEVATIDPFYRALTRLELRCTQETPPQPSPRSFLSENIVEWLGKENVEPQNELSDAAFALKLTDQLASFGDDKPYAKQPKKGVFTWYALSRNAAFTYNKQAEFLDLAIDRAREVSAPVEVLAFLQLLKPFDDRDSSLEHLKRLKAQPEFQGNATIRAILNLTINDSEKRGKNSEYVIGLLQEVIDDPELQEKHPLKIGAQVRLASLFQQLGAEDSARTAFQATGLSAGQCAAVDARPKLLSTGYLSSLYPSNMLHMGITGFTKAEYDITADGTVVNERIVMAYPPFGFTKASEKIIAKGSYEKSYRPDGGLGCSTATNFIQFKTP
ncbi:hypothetical protein [Parasphingorhabdus sp.]|uniref:hypothetical protein n=1 Tax=Parasphingorhabdus sp. TaxID=2709688 RepID=UPI0030029E2A